MHTEEFCWLQTTEDVSNLETEITEVGWCNCWLFKETFELIEGFKSCELWNRVDLLPMYLPMFRRDYPPESLV